jgi:hypothetical protein
MIAATFKAFPGGTVERQVVDDAAIFALGIDDLQIAYVRGEVHRIARLHDLPPDVSR